MRLTLRSIFCIGLVGISSLGITSLVNAQSYPTKPVKMIVPYGTGGGSDILARQISAKLQNMWGQGVIVDNRPGASGNIGSEAVVHSAADGYTLLMQNTTMTTSYAVAGKLNYDPEKDLTPIMILGNTPIALVSTEKLNIKSAKDLVEYSKKNPDALSYGSCGIGTPQNLAMEVLKQQLGVKATHIGYKGCAPALTDVIGGQIPLAIVSANLVAPYVKSGRLHAIGMAANTRYALMPNTLTFEEQGIKPFNYSNWYALMGPAGLPADIVAKIQSDVNKILAEPDVKENLSNAGVEPLYGNAGDLAKLIHEDLNKYTKLVKSINLKLE